ncbi:MAG: hypothetical protein ACRDQ7_02240 [Haloechinothrix sp.]
MKRLIAVAGAGLVALCLAVGSSQAAAGDGNCRPVVGQLEENLVEGEGFQARGRLTGGIQGTDNFTLLSLSDTHPDTPSVSHFVGESLIETRTGDISTIVSGAFDLETGKFSDLFTIVGGTGEWSDATGQLHLFGTFDFATETGRSDYRGEVCTR